MGKGLHHLIDLRAATELFSVAVKTYGVDEYRLTLFVNDDNGVAFGGDDLIAFTARPVRVLLTQVERIAFYGVGFGKAFKGGGVVSSVLIGLGFAELKSFFVLSQALVYLYGCIIVGVIAWIRYSLIRLAELQNLTCIKER